MLKASRQHGDLVVRTSDNRVVSRIHLTTVIEDATKQWYADAKAFGLGPVEWRVGLNLIYGTFDTFTSKTTG